MPSNSRLGAPRLDRCTMQMNYVELDLVLTGRSVGAARHFHCKSSSAERDIVHVYMC